MSGRRCVRDQGGSLGRLRRAVAAVVLPALGLSAGCDQTRPEPAPTGRDGDAPRPAHRTPAQRNAELIELAAAEFGAFERVAENVSVVPADGADPLRSAPASLTAVDPIGGHGGTVYALYASKALSYQSLLDRVRSPEGQTLVMQAWRAQRVDRGGASPAATRSPESGSSTSYPTTDPIARTFAGSRPAAVERGGERWAAGQAVGLFIMRRLEVDAAQTDMGWIYGVVGPDGAVRRSGLIESCIECHRKAPYERLYGLSN